MSDINYIKKIWINHIDSNVSFSCLGLEINKLLKQGVTSDYLVFTINYVINHKMNLHYPGGLKYFINKNEIKSAYTKKEIREKRKEKKSEIQSQSKDDSPMYAVQPKRRPRGFANILTGGR